MVHTDSFRRKQLVRKLMKIIRDEYNTRKQLCLFLPEDINERTLKNDVRVLPASGPGAPPTL